MTRVDFEDGSSAEVDLLVGADGGYSAVRRHILDQRDPSTAEERWLPDFLGMTGIYGVSDAPRAEDAEADFADTHAIWLDRGFLASGPCPGGKTRWDLILPETKAPGHDRAPETAEDTGQWDSKILPSQYPLSDTSEILRKHKDVHHPFAGSLAALCDSADRIVRTPLRQRVWETNEIQHGNVVLIGDAARLLLPTSGQGTGFAIEDATVLADMLAKHQSADAAESNDSMRPALEEYAGLRVPRSTRMATFASTVGQLGLGETWYYRALRYYMYKWLPSWKDDKPRQVISPSQYHDLTSQQVRQGSMADGWPFRPAGEDIVRITVCESSKIESYFKGYLSNARTCRRAENRKRKLVASRAYLYNGIAPGPLAVSSVVLAGVANCLDGCQYQPTGAPEAANRDVTYLAPLLELNIESVPQLPRRAVLTAVYGFAGGLVPLHRLLASM